MMQLVVSPPLPATSRLRQRCLLDPDALLNLETEFRASQADIEELSDRFSLILNDVRMAGAWKRTKRQRLKQTEEMLCAHIPPPLRQDLLLLDIGASDGITTVDALRRMKQVFGETARAYAADLNLWLLRYRRGPVVEYRASNGEPIMVRIGPLGLRLSKSRRGSAAPDYNLLVQLYLQLQTFRRSMSSDAKISLVNPISRYEPGLTIIELDCLKREPSLINRISAVRASNVLNPGYFFPAQIHEAVGHLHAYLRDGGCLVISRNIDTVAGESENGSVWIREPDRLRWIQNFGSGSEVKEIVDDWRYS
jgi:hypothetical protein